MDVDGITFFDNMENLGGYRWYQFDLKRNDGEFVRKPRDFSSRYKIFELNSYIMLLSLASFLQNKRYENKEKDFLTIKVLVKKIGLAYGDFENHIKWIEEKLWETLTKEIRYQCIPKLEDVCEVAGIDYKAIERAAFR